MGNLLRIAFKKPPADDEPFPFSVPTIRTLPALDLSAPMTFFVGENGTGKSTMLEGIAAAAELPAVGGEEVGADDTLAPQRRLGVALRLSWVTRSKRGLFLRAEDFFGHIKRNARIDARIARESGEFGAAQASCARRDGCGSTHRPESGPAWPGALHTDDGTPPQRRRTAPSSSPRCPSPSATSRRRRGQRHERQALPAARRFGVAAARSSASVRALASDDRGTCAVTASSTRTMESR